MAQPMGDSSGAPAPMPRVALVSASQPDFVRAVQKDEMYTQMLVDSCHEAVRNVLGPFAALRYSRQTRLAAVALYNALTTGCGSQTLGEEYCNMLQVDGGSAALPSTSRRAVLVLLQTLGPYLAESASTRLDRAAEEQQQQQRERQQQQQQEAGGDDDAWRKEQAAGRSLSEAGDGFVSDALSSPDPGRSREQPTEFGNGDAAARSSNDSSTQSRGRSWWSSMPSLLQSRWIRRWLLPAWPTRIKPALAFAARLHLALFYCYGAYYQLSHRLAGIRYASTSRSLQGQASYRALGMLLVLQLGLVLLMQAAKESSAIPSNLWGGSMSTSAASGSDVPPQPARVLEQEEPQRQLLPGQQAQLGTSPGHQHQPQQQQQPQGSGGTCPLCLSQRRHPTSTPCGHVFCWACVAQWCTEKPECPLCRTQVQLSQLVPVYHSTLF